MQALINSAILNKLHDLSKVQANKKICLVVILYLFGKIIGTLQIERADVMGSKIKGGGKGLIC